MSLSTTQLRQDLYRIVDEILETGKPVIVVRKGRKLRISPVAEESGRLSRLVKQSIFVGDPNELTEFDWSEYWTEVANLPGTPKKKR